MLTHTYYAQNYAGIIYLPLQKSSHQGRDSEGLPPQPESPSSTVTSRQLSTSESATGQQNPTKLGKLFVICAYTVLCMQMLLMNQMCVHAHIHVDTITHMY